MFVQSSVQSNWVVTKSRHLSQAKEHYVASAAVERPSDSRYAAGGEAAVRPSGLVRWGVDTLDREIRRIYFQKALREIIVRHNRWQRARRIVEDAISRGQVEDSAGIHRRRPPDIQIPQYRERAWRSDRAPTPLVTISSECAAPSCRISFGRVPARRSKASKISTFPLPLP
jgi:hypothetical protein